MNFLNSYQGDKLNTLYIPHRNESSNQLKKVVELGFIISNLNLPIELSILNGIGIRSVYSICSSAIINLDILYSNMIINLFLFGNSWSKSKMGNKMKNIELNYEVMINQGKFKNTVNLMQY